MDTESLDKKMYDEKFSEPTIIGECESEPIRIVGKNGPFIIRVPVVISQTRIHIHVENKIKLEHPAVDILNCNRNVYVTRCRLLDTGNKRIGKLYIDGYIRHSIEYIHPVEVNEWERIDSVRYTTINIPFECTSKVEYHFAPSSEIVNRMTQVDFLRFDNASQTQDVYADTAHGGYNPGKIFCEIDDISIREMAAIKEAYHAVKSSAGKKMFNTFVDHIMVTITFTLLQKQFVNIPKQLPY